MSGNLSFGDRMKQYEEPYHRVLPRRTYTILRVDGRAFHTLLKKAVRPWDNVIVDAMNEVALELCAEIQGAQLAYTQSDEVSVLYTDFAAPGTQAWFGGDLAKQISVGASVATWMFNSHVEDYENVTGYAEFDARVFTIPDPVEVANYFLWRQRDAVRNSILALGQHYFSHSQLQKKNGGEIQEMLFSQHNINWNDQPDGLKRGRIITQHGQGWHVSAAPHFKAESGSFLARAIPQMSRLDQ